MILFLLTYSISSNINITKVLIGNWNISKFQLTTNGVEVPDNNTYFLLDLYFNGDENYIYGNIHDKPKTENLNESIFIQLDQLTDSSFSVKVKPSTNTQEYSELVTLKINIGLDDMITATEKFGNNTFSLIISSPTSAELTTFDQNTKQVSIYRLNKKISGRRLNFYHILPFITTFLYTTIKFLIS